MTVKTDVYFSADVETDGPIPGPYSMLSFPLVHAGRFDGSRFEAPESLRHLYLELRPISKDFQVEALEVDGLDRDRLLVEGRDPREAMTEAAAWVRSVAGPAARMTEGLTTPTLERRRAFSRDRLDALRTALESSDAQLAQQACVYVTGSFGRMEGGEHSDLDPFGDAMAKLVQSIDPDGELSRLLII